MATKPKLDADLSGKLVDQTDYRSKIGSLTYLTSSRPDIYPKDSGFELTAFSDVDHAGCIDTRKSTSGGIQFLGDKLVNWMSKKQDCTAMSSAEVEYVALSTSCAQVMWTRTQLKDYGFNNNKIPLANPTDCLSLVSEQIFPTGGSNCKENGGNQQFSNEPDENPLSKNRLCVLRTLIDEVSSSLFAEMKEQIEPIRKKIKKVNEKVYAAQVGCKQCKGPHYTKDCPLKEEGKTLEEAYYMQFGGPFQGGRYRATAMGCCQKEPRSIDQNFRDTNRANEQAEYGISTSIGYGVSSSLSNTAYSLKLINTAYPLPLDTAYRLSGTEAEILCMTRSSTNKLFTPYKEPEREFRSSRRHFKTLSLDELRSPDFNLLSDQEYSEEEEPEAMAKTMEQ
ncbi:retrovirus-related pol polyprotein from transposon TNT 1-94 [Tanacetum coccineum]